MKNADEPQKSIWKKSWNLPGSFLGWLILVTGIALFISLLGALIVNGMQVKKDWGIVAIVTVISVAGTSLFFFIRWLCCWRNFRRFLFGLAGLAVLIVLFYAEEDWRGWHAWQKFKHEWEAKGEKFDFASFVPQPVPDDQNFAMTPIVFTSYGSMLTRDGKVIPNKNRDTNFVDRLKMAVAQNDNRPTNGAGIWQKSTVSDLKAWQEYYRTLAKTTNEFPVAQSPQTPAADVLLALSKYDSAIEELRQASLLPYSRFPIDYDTECPAVILLPHLAGMKRPAIVLQLRAIAELQNGQSEKALEDIKLSLRLADSIRTEPILISHLVRMALVNITFQPIWEGLAEHKWSDAQLIALDQELAKLDFLVDYEFSMRSECAMDIKMVEWLRHQRPSREISKISQMSSDDSGLKPSDVIIFYLGPSGWIDQCELRISWFFVQHYLPAANTDLKIISPTSIKRADDALYINTKYHCPYNTFLERVYLPALGAVAKKCAYCQESVDLARVSIASERYWLAHGKYPESLDALAPQFIAKLPHDIINGQPLHYRRTADGQFVLYSVGWNEKDDGGVVGLTEGGSVDIAKGDWVWRYPSK
jgi:tetratricopeptide (TPR) repeat protein